MVSGDVDTVVGQQQQTGNWLRAVRVVAVCGEEDGWVVVVVEREAGFTARVAAEQLEHKYPGKARSAQAPATKQADGIPMTSVSHSSPL